MLTIEEAIDEIKALRDVGNGNILILVPRLVEQMTEPDHVKVLEWHVQEGDIVQSNMPMLTVEFLQDDWYLPIPPIEGLLRVVRIVAPIGGILHLNDPLIVLASCERQKSEFLDMLH